MLSATSSNSAEHGQRHQVANKAGSDGFPPNRPLAEITNTPRRAFHDLTNRMQSKASEHVPTHVQISKEADAREKVPNLQSKIALETTIDSKCKDSDSIEHCFGSSEPEKWKGEIDALDYLKSLQDPASDFEEQPMSYVPLVNIPHLPEGFFDDIPDDLLDEVSEGDQDEPSIFV